MRDLDRVDPRRVERGGDGTHLVQAVLVTHGMAAVAQGHVGDIEFLAVHAEAPIARAMRSAVASAAEVMMSRLPA